MSGATTPPASPWRPVATAAYFLAGLVVLTPGIGLVFTAWPPHPSLLSWRHVSSDTLIAAAPMLGAAAVGILLAARVRGDTRVLQLLRRCGRGALVLGVAFAVLYTVDFVLLYHRIPVEVTRSLVRMEIRMFTVMAIGLGLVWMFSRVARGASGADPTDTGGGVA